MKKMKYILFSLSLLFAGNVFAQKLTGADVTIAKGGEAELVVSLETPKVAKNTQFELILPAGIEVVQEEGEYIWDAGDILYRSPQVTVAKNGDGNITVIISKVGTSTYKALSGSLIKLPLVANSAEVGEYEGKIVGIKAGDANGSVGTFADTTFKITVTDPSGIESITVDDIKDAKVYTIDGQRVDNITKKGVYIVNGKKMVIK